MSSSNLLHAVRYFYHLGLQRAWCLGNGRAQRQCNTSPRSKFHSSRSIAVRLGPFSALPAQVWVAPHNPMASSSPKPNCQNTTFFFSKGRYRPVLATISPDAARISAYSKACSKSRERASALTGEIPLFRKFIAYVWSAQRSKKHRKLQHLLIPGMQEFAISSHCHDTLFSCYLHDR